MKTTTARISIEILVDCPHCESLIDLLKQEDTNGVWHDDDNAVMGQAITDTNWYAAHELFEVDDVTCTQCKKSFNVKKVKW